MAVRKRKGSRFYQYEFQLHGRRFRGSTKAETLDAAQAVETKIRHDLLIRAATGKKAEITLDAAAARYWLDHVTINNNRPEAQKFTITVLLRDLGKATLLSELDNRKLTEQIARWRGAGSAPGTVNRYLKILRTIMRRAADILDCAVSKPDWPKLMMAEPEPLERYISPDEATRLIAAASAHLKPIIQFALLTGVRKGSIIDLDWRQISLQDRNITFRVKSNKPGRKRHDVAISDPLLMLLVSLGPKERGRVFLREEWRGKNKGKMVPVGSMKTAWAATCRRAGLVPNEDDDETGIRFHDLRHTAASWMLQNDVPLELVQRILGHSDIKTTMRYAHHKPGAKAQGLATLGAHFSHSVDVRDGQDVDKEEEKSVG